MIFQEVSPSTEELQGPITMGDGKQELGEFSENTSTLALMVYNPVICYIKIKQPVRSDSRDRRATKGQRMRE
ncbi:hypothetical protein ACOSQ3_007024 [Xanthoceras sorbifolium]